MARTNSWLTQTHARQLTTGGLGVHFSSPVKCRDKRKTLTIVHVPGHQYKKQLLLKEIEYLLHRSSQSPTPEVPEGPDSVPQDAVEHHIIEDDTLDDDTGEASECIPPRPQESTK
jgi:hypothetical protein